MRVRIEVLTDEAVATSAIEGIHLDREIVRQAVMRRLALLASEDADGPRAADDFDAIAAALEAMWKKK